MRTTGFRLIRCIGPRTLFPALAVLVALAMTPTPTRAQCGTSLSESKNCTSPRIVGQTNQCTITLTDSDPNNNTYTVDSASDQIFSSNGTPGTCSPTTDSGLLISAASGNTNCTVGSAGSCKLGPACNGTTVVCISGVTAPAAAGSVTFADSGYTITAGDTNISGGTCGTAGNHLNDLGTIQVNDNCDVCSSGCSTATTPETASASTLVNSCSVAMDKQVSCDNGATWHDVSINGGGETVDDSGNSSTLGCTGFTGDTILVRYIVKNTGNTELDSCTLGDTNSANFTTLPTVGAGGVLTAGQTFDTNSTTNVSATCNSTVTAGEPDTGSVDCVCAGTGGTVHKTASDTAQFQCESCSVSVDKQVTCPSVGGTTYDVSCTNPPTNDTPAGCDPVDANGHPTTTQSSSCIAYSPYCTNGTTPVGTTCPNDASGNPGTYVAQSVGVGYVITNTGQDSITCTGTDPVSTDTLGLNDTDASINGTNSVPGVNTTFISGATQTITATPACSSALNTAESGGDTATLECRCAALNNNTKNKDVTASDSALFSCQQPTLVVSKTCGDQDGSGNSAVSVVVTNNGSTPLTNCTISDQYTTAGACPQTMAPGAGTASSLTGTQPFDLAASGGTTTFTGTINGLPNTSCNQADVTCDLGTSTVQITGASEATCHVGAGCETRTPGFWGTHPAITNEVLNGAAGGFIQNCGVDMTAADNNPGVQCSAGEDLCSQGKDSNLLSLDPSDIQLQRQCMSAELNLVVTGLDGGSCETGDPGITGAIGNCCSTVCTDPITNAAQVNSCIGLLDAFNNQFDNVTLPNATILSSPGSAQPGNCQVENGDAFVNDLTGGSSNACGGPGRTYATKTTGKKH